MRGTSKVGTLLLALGIAGVGACAAEGSDPGGAGGAGANTVCIPNEQVSCACPGGTQGVQVCLEDGSGFGECDCDGTGASGGGGPCGDDFCDEGDEHCHSCPEDCGTCDPCDIAPKCPDQGAMVPPAASEHFPDLDVPAMTRLSPAELHSRLVDEVSQGTLPMRMIAAAFDAPQPHEHPFVTMLRNAFAENAEQAEAIRFELDRAGMRSARTYRQTFPAPSELETIPELKPRADEFPGGTLECGRPFLRVGISRITVHDDQDGAFQGNDDEIYCVVQAEAQNGIELRVTPLSPSIDDDDHWDLSLTTGVFWGQVEQAHPGSDLLITYDCIENDNPAAYQALLDTIADGANAIGGAIGDENGWIFITGAAVASIASAAMGLNGEDRVFNYQQYILLDDQLELTNGYYWSVRRDGGDWDWELTVKAWGCAEFGLL